MEGIQKYIDRFFKTKEKNMNYTLSIGDMTAFMSEIQEKGIDEAFHAVLTLFNYGYVKGYRACLVEKKKIREKMKNTSRKGD